MAAAVPHVADGISPSRRAREDRTRTSSATLSGGVVSGRSPTFPRPTLKAVAIELGLGVAKDGFRFPRRFEAFRGPYAATSYLHGRDAPPLQLDVERTCQAIRGEIAGMDARNVGRRDRGRRGDPDDSAFAGPKHREESLYHGDGADQSRPELALEAVQVHQFHGSHGPSAGVEDQRREPRYF